MHKNSACKETFPEGTSLGLIVFHLRQEKHHPAGILSHYAVLLLRVISPKLLQMTRFEKVPQCKCKTKHTKKE